MPHRDPQAPARRWRKPTVFDATSDARMVLLRVVVRRPEWRVEELAEAAYLSVGAVRLHLADLVKRGYVSVARQAQGVGRPANLYSITDVGRSLFPTGYEYSLLAVLAVLKSAHPDVYEEVFSQLPRWMTPPDLRPADVVPLSPARRTERLKALVDLFGHEFSLEMTADGPRVEVFNCAVIEAARRHPGLCSAELEWWNRYFPDQPMRCHGVMAKGATSCVFAAEPPAAGDD